MATPSLSGSDIYRRLARRYSEVRSFQQVGRLERTSADGKRRWLRFTIVFVRPSLMAFDYDDSFEARATLRANGTHTVAWFSASGDHDSYTSIDDALETMAGVSQGTSWLVPGLLLGRPTSWFSAGFADSVRFIARQRCDDAQCYVLTEDDGSGREFEIWVDERSYLLRRTVERDSKCPPVSDAKAGKARQGSNEETTTYELPQIDGTIEVKRFDPDGEPGDAGAALPK